MAVNSRAKFKVWSQMCHGVLPFRARGRPSLTYPEHFLVRLQSGTQFPSSSSRYKHDWFSFIPSHKTLQGKLLDSVLLLPSSPSSKGKGRCALKAALSRPEEQVFLSSCSLRLWWAPQWESGLCPLLWRSEKQPSPLTELSTTGVHA